VLVGLDEIKQMLQVISANQSKLNLNLLPNEKVISIPQGMPTLPVKTLKDLDILEKYLECTDNISNMVSGFSLKLPSLGSLTRAETNQCVFLFLSLCI